MSEMTMKLKGKVIVGPVSIFLIFDTAFGMVKLIKLKMAYDMRRCYTNIWLIDWLMNHSVATPVIFLYRTHLSDRSLTLVTWNIVVTV